MAGASAPAKGHSVDVELGYAPAVPPDVLYHGTADRNLDSIRRAGLLKGQRHHVHLSPDPATAANVGQRYGQPVVLKIDAAAMHAAGMQFFISTNGVWLTDHIPPRYIALDSEKSRGSSHESKEPHDSAG